MRIQPPTKPNRGKTMWVNPTALAHFSATIESRNCRNFDMTSTQASTAIAAAAVKLRSKNSIHLAHDIHYFESIVGCKSKRRLTQGGISWRKSGTLSSLI